MPRTARQRSKTGIYHVMVRGIDKRNIFLAPEDYEKFLDSINKAKEKSEFTLLAYCLMTNHVHLLIKEGNEEIGDSIRRINVSYAQYHNRKHGRTGHLFQNRFQSEVVNDDNYLMVVVRYIHKNPIKAGIVANMLDYKWSSFKNYIAEEEESIIDKDICMGCFSNRNNFINFHNQDNDDKCLDYTVNKIYTDEQLRKVIEEIIEIKKLPMMKIDIRDKFIRRIKEDTGASIRQLERVLGIGRNIIQKS